MIESAPGSQKLTREQWATAALGALGPLLLTDSDAFAGTERHMLDLARALAAAGVDAQIGCPEDSILERRCRQHGLKVITAPASGYFFSMSGKVANALHKGEVNLVHSHNGVSHLASILAARLAGKGVCVVTQHFVAPARTTRRGWRSLAGKVLHGWAAERTDHFIAISHAVSGTCEEIYRCPQEKLSIVHNGIYPINGALESKQEARLRFAVSVHSQLVVAIARLVPEKSLDV